MFIGWDGLGVSSYFLVIFYQNWKSLNAGLVTILSNRVGDCFFIIIFISLIIYKSDKIINLFSISSIFIFIYIIFCLTKRAQFPFSTWLPAAIAAPTPVSSLVHSRTLVTAGFYLLFRFFEVNQSYNLIFLTLIFSFCTILYAGINGLTERDFKKIIALSTLRQISLIFISLRLELKLISFFHLFTHAYFKRLLFISVGAIIHIFFNNQDLRNYNLIFSNSIKIGIFLSIFSLTGLFFSSGFFRKDFILEKIFLKNGSIIIIWLFFLRIFLTIFYSLRLLNITFLKNPNIKIYFFTKRKFLILSIFFIRLVSLIVAFFINWNFIYFYNIISYIKTKIFILSIFFNAVLLFFVFNKNFSFVYIINNILLLRKITFFLNRKILTFKKLISFCLEKRIIEIYERNISYKIRYFNFSYLYYKISYFIIWILIIIIIFLF